jgi:hypothetical protein
MVAMADEVEIDGIYYKLVSKLKIAEVIREPNYPYNYRSTVIYIPSKVIYNDKEYSVTSIGGYAFSGCTSLSSITIPNSVTSIEDNVFQGCTALNTIVVESGNLTYDSRDNCNAIIETASNALITGCKKTFIPNSVTSIGWGAFYGCTNLSSISIPNSVTSIGWGAFYVCTGLTEVTIGSDIEKIDEYSFCNCKDLLNIYCYSKNVPTTASNAFLDSDQEYITLHVPATSINAYKNTEPWCYFRDIVALTDDDPKPTGIGEVRSQKKEANKEIYDLQGRKVQNPRNGLYIIDGKKAVIK